MHSTRYRDRAPYQMTESLRDITNQQLNLEIAKLSRDYSEGYFDKNPNNAPEYTNHWDELMPLAISYGINFRQTTLLGVRTGNLHAYDCLENFTVMKCENPKRAIAECLLLELRRLNQRQ